MLQMMKGFQIWAQNVNREIFDSRFGQRTVENWILPVLKLFGPKRGSNVVD